MSWVNQVKVKKKKKKSHLKWVRNKAMSGFSLPVIFHMKFLISFAINYLV